MTSWYSNLLTKTSSQISNLRTTLLASEADGDTEDDTHACRVLRNYYTEKGRPFPPWLPPDPKAPAQAAPVQPLYAQAGGNNSQRLGTPSQQGGGGGAGGLSSLWNNGGGQQQQQAPQSLRPGRGGGMQRPSVGGGMDPPGSAGAGPRPGNYQGGGGSREGTPSGGSSAQDRLRQRLRGGARTTSPGQGAQSPFQPPGGGGGYEQPQMSANISFNDNGGEFGNFSGYDVPGGYGGGGGGPPGGGGGPRPAPGRRQGLPSGPRAYR